MLSLISVEEVFNMRRKTSYIICLTLCILFSFGQQDYRVSKKVSRIGVAAGLSYNTQVKTKDSFFPVSYSYYNRYSPYLGLVFKDSLNKFLSLKIGLCYVQRGVQFNWTYKINNPYYYLHTDDIYTGHYITLPIRLNFNYRGFFIGAGIEASILLTFHDYNYTEQDLGVPGSHTTFVTTKNYNYPNYQPADVGYSFSIGYRYKNFEIEGSMFHGLIQPKLYPYFAAQHFEFKAAYQETFNLHINYYPKFKHILK